MLDFSRLGKPTDNAFIEAFDSKLRSDCLNAHWFLSLQDTCEKLEAWRRHYNEERPHSAIGNIPPIMLANSAGETSPRSEEHTSELQSLMRISYAVFCLTKNKISNHKNTSK